MKNNFRIISTPNFGVHIHKLHEKCVFKNFMVYLPTGDGPEGGTWKKWKMAYKSPFPSFLLKNKHTFFSETFHLIPEYTFWFLIFAFFPPQTDSFKF
jgi:hypothetical protein